MLIRHDKITSDEFIDYITNQEITVYEDVQGSKIWVNYINGRWLIRPGRLINDPINLVDLAMQKFYKYVYAYLLSLPNDVTNLLSANTYFCFEYFPDNQPANIIYDRIPKNRLILTCINKFKKKYSYSFDELKVYADLFNVETLPIIYKGRLSNKQIKQIVHFLYTSEQDKSLFFRSKDFVEFFYNLLNPFERNSYLKNGFQDNLEKIIIRFEKNESEITLEILNPMYQRLQLTNNSEYADVYSLLLFNFTQWLVTADLDDYGIRGNTRELIYINLMSMLFNDYIKLHGDKILSFKFTIPQFFNTDKFKINTKFIQNEETIKLIANPKFEYLFKIVLGGFRKRHKKEIGILNQTVLDILNTLVDKITVKCETQFSYNTKLDDNVELRDISKYQNIKWEEDNKGYVYPEIDSIFGNSDGEEKDKLKKHKLK